MNHLDKLENDSIFMIREAYAKFPHMCLLWSIGKDSSTLLWLCRKAFFGKVPFPVMHIDTTFKFPEMYKFRDHYAKEWNLDLIVETNEEAIAKGINYDNADAFTCCHELKTVALQKAIIKHQFKAIVVGIRRDEHGIRSKERFFSPRSSDFKWDYKDQPVEMWDLYKAQVSENTHVRVHPLLQWTEVDIWEYIQREKMPINELYFAKDNKRYRSLGCMPITTPIESNATTVEDIISELKATKEDERAGRAQDKESVYVMQKLRALGYM